MKLLAAVKGVRALRWAEPPRRSSSGRTNGTGVLGAVPACGPIRPAILISSAFHPRACDHSVVAANSMNVCSGVKFGSRVTWGQ
jgi:hypothetical protein